MKLFAIFALLVCAVLALTGASPVGAELGSAQPALGEPDSAPLALRERRSASPKKKGGYGYGYGYRG